MLLPSVAEFGENLPSALIENILKFQPEFDFIAE